MATHISGIELATYTPAVAKSHDYRDNAPLARHLCAQPGSEKCRGIWVGRRASKAGTELERRNRRRRLINKEAICVDVLLITAAGSRLRAQMTTLPCYYCDKEFAGGIDRFISSGNYQCGNVVPACPPCNRSKQNMHPVHMFAHAHRIAVYMRTGVVINGWTSWPNHVARRAPRPYPFRQWARKAENGQNGHAVHLTEALYWDLVHRPCQMCGDARAKGIDRIDSDVDYRPDNVQPACMVCNFMKSTEDNDEFLARIQRIVAKYPHGEMFAVFRGATAVGPSTYFFIDSIGQECRPIREDSDEWRRAPMLSPASALIVRPPPAPSPTLTLAYFNTHSPTPSPPPQPPTRVAFPATTTPSPTTRPLLPLSSFS